jgi:hypothetical protein
MQSNRALATMANDTLLPINLPAVARKKVTAAFDGGRLSSDGGVLLLGGVERRLGIVERLAGCIVDRRDPSRIDHEIVEMLRLSASQILIADYNPRPFQARRQCRAWRLYSSSASLSCQPDQIS